MPGDTLYFLNDHGDTVHRLSITEPGRVVEDSRTEPSTGWPVAFPFIVIGFAFLIPILIKWLRRGIDRQKARKVYDDKQMVYNNILDRFNPYFHKLPDDLKERFLKRTLRFMTSKRFKYVELEAEEHMPLLISAAAVQLTFGLENYLMDHFHTIYIVKSDYNYGLYNVPFQGHVNHDGIYLSWNNFLRAFENYSDGDNVGLHEMAHALSYVNFIADDGSDDGFKERFKKFSETGRAVFKAVQTQGSSFLGDYAGTNYEEFWAVCVENFFERPLLFHHQLPALYKAMCNLLNQDMLERSLLINPVEAA